LPEGRPGVGEPSLLDRGEDAIALHAHPWLRSCGYFDGAHLPVRCAASSLVGTCSCSPVSMSRTVITPASFSDAPYISAQRAPRAAAHLSGLASWRLADRYTAVRRPASRSCAAEPVTSGAVSSAITVIATSVLCSSPWSSPSRPMIRSTPREPPEAGTSGPPRAAISLS